MSFLEWKKFTFFDLKYNADNGIISQTLKDIKITAVTSGNNFLIFGDSKGHVHLVSRTWNITSFKAHTLQIYLAYQLKNESILVTVGQDGKAINTVIKVWDLSRFESVGHFCCHVTPIIAKKKKILASALCVDENKHLLAVGFADGSIVLYRGDIMRSRKLIPKLMRNNGPSITGLAFQTTQLGTFLFLSTNISVSVYNVGVHKAHEIFLDKIGCPKNCSTLTESVQEGYFVVASDKAVHFYIPDGKGPCYAINSEKEILECFRNYLVIVSKTKNSGLESNVITILDIKNKLLILSESISEIKVVFKEWGTLFILDSEYNVHHLDEKDLETKLSMLSNRNLYDLAIRIANNEHYDLHALMDIFQEYGDHLYKNGAHSDAIEQYIKTIGKLEPSYVIKRFEDFQHLELLLMYLKALDDQEKAKKEHITLLLNCLVRLNKIDQLEQIILTKKSDEEFDVDFAIRICRKCSPHTALTIAKRYKRHEWFIELLIEDHNKYFEVINYISTLCFKEAEFFMKKHGEKLIQNSPDKSIQFLKKLCTNYNARIYHTNDLFEEKEKSNPEFYIHYFMKKSEYLVEFLEYLIQEKCELDAPIYDVLLDNYLVVWECLESNINKSKYSEKILKLIQDPVRKYDKSQALLFFHLHKFHDGILYLYKEQELYQDILRYHLTRNDTRSALSSCRSYGKKDPSLWIDTLYHCFEKPESQIVDILQEILSIIEQDQLLPFQSVVRILTTRQSTMKLHDISKYLINEFKIEEEIIEADMKLINKYEKDIKSSRELCYAINNGPIIIQGSRCAACDCMLELPSIHFLCQHRYHYTCYQSFQLEDECPVCQPKHMKILQLLKVRDQNKEP